MLSTGRSCGHSNLVVVSMLCCFVHFVTAFFVHNQIELYLLLFLFSEPPKEFRMASIFFLQGISQVVKCCCGEEYKVEVALCI